MSEVRLVAREEQQDWSGLVHGSTADRAVAALSADPVTLIELNTAFARFSRPDPDGRLFACFSSGLNDEPYDAGLVVIDLVARMVVVDSTYSSPGSSGDIRYHNGECCTDVLLRYHLADDWLFVGDGIDWQATADARRRERAGYPPFDARAVFYGRPLLEYIARETLAAFSKSRQSAETPTTVEDAIRGIHAAWLLTPRDDLQGACPRDVAFMRREHLDRDMQDRCDQWSRLGASPPGIDESSSAWRYAGFGIHEMVMYYDLVRELLWSCWKRLADLEQSPNHALRPAMLTAGDLLTSEVPRLEAVRDRWLDEPDPDFHGRTPRSIIDRERSRLPEAVSGREAMIDPDCPCCQMMADLPGPMFWHLDGCEMDDDFAFDLFHRTREEYDEEQRDWEERSRRFDREHEERERLGISQAPFYGIAEDLSDKPLEVRLFGVGCLLAGLIVEIRGTSDLAAPSPDAQQHIDRLNRDFGNLRDVLQKIDPDRANALVDPVIVRFVESLDAVAVAHPDFAEQCEALTNTLSRFLNPASPDTLSDFDDDEFPF